MQSFGTRLSRRHVLRGAGVSLALPLLNGMLSRSAIGAPSQFKPWKESKAVQPRVIYCYVPNGVNILEWVPKTLGKDYELSPTLSVLKDHKADFSVISGLGHYNASGGHNGADTWLTGANLKGVPGSDYSNSISIDQVIAEKHGKQTRIPSLELSDLSGTGGSGHSHTLSFDRTGTPLPAEDSPRRLFERLFVPETAVDRAATLRRYAARKSVLDSVLADAKGLKKKLGTEDQKKLEQYLSSVRQTEERVERLEKWVDVEKPQVDPSLLQLASKPQDAHDRPMWLDVMLELTYLSFACDVTRVVTFEWSREAGGYGGGGENHHELSHHGGDEGMLSKLATIDRFHLERLGRFISFLKETDEAGNRMLDNTIIMFGSGMNSGERGDHSPRNLPLLVAGGKSLGFKHGQHLNFGDNQTAKEPLSAVLLATARGMGIEQEKFVDAASPLPGLLG